MENEKNQEILEAILENQNTMNEMINTLLNSQNKEFEENEQVEQGNTKMQQDSKVYQNKKNINYIIAGILILIILKIVAG